MQNMANTLAVWLNMGVVPPTSVLAEAERQGVSGHDIMRAKLYLIAGLVEEAERPEEQDVIKAIADVRQMSSALAAAR